MQTFKEYLKNKDPKVYNEILGTMALGLGAAGLIAPKTTGRALKYVAKKGVDLAAGTAGHVINKGIDLTADAIKGGATLAGKGLYHGAALAGKGIKKAFERPATPA